MIQIHLLKDMDYMLVSGGTNSIDLRTGNTSAYGQQKIAIKYSNGE